MWPEKKKKGCQQANNKNSQLLSTNVLSHFQKANAIDFHMRASCQLQRPLQLSGNLELAWQKELQVDKRIPPLWGVLENSMACWSARARKKVWVNSADIPSSRKPPPSAIDSVNPFFLCLGAITCPSPPRRLLHSALPLAPALPPHVLSTYQTLLSILGDVSVSPLRLESSRGKYQIRSLPDP